MPVIRSLFRPAWWLPGPHPQTLWPSLFRRRPKLDLTARRLELPDGDFPDLAFGGEPNRLPRGYHSGETGDLQTVVKWLHREVAPVDSAIGFSLGGKVLPRQLMTKPHSERSTRPGSSR
ncbi:MAG TPA: hydrolase, partial [Chromatiales bacterium]|nr:hydrolase [Chromatiales bacterium]